MFGSTCGLCLPLEWFMPYEYQEFPCWVAHESGKQQIVHSDEQFDALGDGWKKPEHVKPKVHIDEDTFQHYPKWIGNVLVNSAQEEMALTPTPEQMCEAIVNAPAEPESYERAALIQIAAEKGVTIDKRWGTDKIRAALEAA